MIIRVACFGAVSSSSLPLPDHRLGAEVFGRLMRQSHRLGKLFGTLTGEQNMAGFRHHFTGQRNRILDSSDTGHRAATQVAPIHDRRVQFVFSRLVEHGTSTRVKQRIILQMPYHLFDHVQARPSFGQHLATGLQSDVK
jgi:hypothetical protein